MWTKATLKCLYGITENVAHCDVSGRSIGRPACESPIHRVIFAACTHSGFHQWHVLVAVVLVVESGTGRVRIHHTNLYHSILLDEAYIAPAFAISPASVRVSTLQQRSISLLVW